MEAEWEERSATVKSKTKPPKRKDEVPNDNRGKTDFPNRNHDIKCFKYLGTFHIAS